MATSKTKFWARHTSKKARNIRTSNTWYSAYRRRNTRRYYKRIEKKAKEKRNRKVRLIVDILIVLAIIITLLILPNLI